MRVGTEFFDLERVWWIALGVVVTTLCGWMMAATRKALDDMRAERREKREAQERGMAEIRAELEQVCIRERYILKDRILQACQHWGRQGYCPLHSKETLCDMFNAYSDAGGNSFVHAELEVVLGLPNEPGDDGRKPVLHIDYPIKEET